MNSHTTLFLLDEAEITPPPVEQQPVEQQPVEQQPVNNPQGALDAPVQNEQLIPFTELEKKSRIYKIFINLNKSFQQTKTFNSKKTYSVPPKVQLEINSLIRDIGDRFEIAFSTFPEYHIDDQIKIIKNTQNKVKKLQSLLKYI